MAADPNIYFDASFGGVPLLLASISTEHGRDIAVQSPSRGSKHVLQDRGLKLTSTQATILFIDQPGFAPFTQRYEDFRKLVELGDSQIFSHPLDGSFQARASDFHVDAESGTGEIRCSATFLREDEPQTVFPSGAGASATAGLEAVETASSSATAALTDAGLTSTVPSSCLASVTEWATSTDLDSQKVFVEVAALTQQISDAVDVLDLATDLARWPAYQAMVNLHYQVSRAAEAVTSSSSQLFSLTVASPTPLRAICAQVYGAAEAEDRAAQVAKLNRIRTPGRVATGTILKMPAVGL